MRPLLAALALASLASALDISKLEPRGYVNDFAGALDPRAAAGIETYLGDVERATGAQVAVVLVKSLEGDTIEDAAVRLFEKWKIGQAKTDEGVLLMFAMEDRKNRIEVGYGLVRAVWGQGLATELARESVHVGFALLHRPELVSFTLPTNAASRRVMEKAGFHYERDIIHADLPHVLAKALDGLGGPARGGRGIIQVEVDPVEWPS